MAQRLSPSIIYKILLKDNSLKQGSHHLHPTEIKNHFIITPESYKSLKAQRIRFETLKEIDIAPLKKKIIYPRKSFLYAAPERDAIIEICARILSSRKKGKLPYAIFLGRNPHLQTGAFILDRPGGKRQYQWRLSYRKTPVKSLAASFPKLLRHIRDSDTKFVLSLGGGGMRMLAHTSIMKFIDTMGVKSLVDEIWGCSGGAIAGLAYTLNVSPEKIEEIGYDAYNRRFHITLTPSLLHMTKNLLRGIFRPSSPQLLRGFISLQQQMQELANRVTRRRKVQIPFYCLAYNVKAQHVQVLTPLKPQKRYYGQFIVHAEPIDAIIASSAVPFLFTPKEIRHGRFKDQYIDGSVIEEVPLMSIYQKWLLDRKFGLEKRSKLLILAVDLFPRFAQPWLEMPLLNRFPLFDFISFGIRLIDLVRSTRMQHYTEALRNDEKINVVQLTLPLRTFSVFNTGDIPAIIKNSQTSFLDQMLEMERSL